MSVPSPDATLLDLFGETVRFVPQSGSGYDVTMIRKDPSSLGENIPGAVKALFGTLDDSGFTDYPVNNDQFEIDDVLFRVFKVKRAEGGALFVFLTHASTL